MCDALDDVLLPGITEAATCAEVGEFDIRTCAEALDFVRQPVIAFAVECIEVGAFLGEFLAEVQLVELAHDDRLPKCHEWPLPGRSGCDIAVVIVANGHFWKLVVCEKIEVFL